MKIVIFDLDGTLYNLDDVVPMYYSMEVDFIEKYYKKTKEETEKFLNDNGVLPYRTEGAKSATDLFIKSGVPTEVWTEYREKYFDPSCIDKNKAVRMDVIKKFSDKFKIILLSSNTFKNIKRILGQIEIDYTVFDEIVSSDRNLGMKSFSKYEAMKLISEKYGVPTSEIVSIGDRYNTDILPAIDAGCMGILVKVPGTIEKIYEDIMGENLGKSEEYRVYGGNT